MIYEEKELTNEDLLKYYKESNRELEGLVRSMHDELIGLRKEVQTMRQEIKYNSLLAKTSSPILPEEERKSAALEILKINESNNNRQLDPNGGFEDENISAKGIF